MLGNNVSISDYANIYSHTHSIVEQKDVTNAVTRIDDGVRITYHATVLAGVHVNEQGMVGAMAVATKDVRPYHVYVGIPAKSVRVKPNAHNQKYLQTKADPSNTANPLGVALDVNAQIAPGSSVSATLGGLTATLTQPVTSTTGFVYEIDLLRTMVRQAPAGTRFINATEGGAFLEGMEHITLAEVIARPSTRARRSAW